MKKYLLETLFALAMVACSTDTVSVDDDFSGAGSSKGENFSSGFSSSSVTSSDSGEICAGEVGNAWNGMTAKNFACGAGTKRNPYVILTAEELSRLSFVVGSDDVNFRGKYYRLGADIVLNEDVVDENGILGDTAKLHKWTPIGNSKIAFTGDFDGNGHTVSGMFINTTSSHNGLFGNSEGNISNLTVKNSWVKGGEYTAGIVGQNKSGILKNLTNGSFVFGADNTGGIAGGSGNWSEENSIVRCENFGYVQGEKSVGGIVGVVFNAKIDSVENRGSVIGESHVGGIVGNTNIGMLSSYPIAASNAKNEGSVDGQKYVGGIIGVCGEMGCNNAKYSIACGTLNNIENSGTVTGKDYTGGVAGLVCRGEYSALKNSGEIVGNSYVGGLWGQTNFSVSASLYNRGNVQASRFVGGLVGYNREGVTSSAYTTGLVNGDSLVGLVIGYNYNATMADYYYLDRENGEPFGSNDGGGVAYAKFEEDMKTEAFAELLGKGFVIYPDWNDGYPSLVFERK